jgi:hypothetical protein
MRHHFEILLRTLWCVLLAIASACSSDPAPTDPDDGDPGDTNPAFAYIGFGYDLTMNWADQNGKRGIVFDAAKVPTAYVQNVSLEDLSYRQFTATSVEEYESRMSAGLAISGSYRFFSGAVRANFDDVHYRYSGRSFSTIQFYDQKSRTHVIANYATAPTLRAYMDAKARADLDGSMTPRQIFTLYGTHVMTGAIMGARFDFNATIETSRIVEGSSFEAMARAGFASFYASAGVEGSFRTQEERTNFQQNAVVSLRVYGGRSELALNDASLSQWRQSIDANRVWMNFTDGGLIPIWEFCTDPVRAQQIRDALPAWIDERAIKVDPMPEPPGECIVDIFTSNRDAAETVVRNGLTYYKLAANLNGGTSSGDVVYLYYALGPDTTSTGAFTPITDLHLGLGTSSASAQSDAAAGGFSPIGVDLNAGAGGAFLYLAVKRSPGALPVRALQVYNQTVRIAVYSRNADESLAFFDVPSRVGRLDLNRGAGGHFIYLLYSHEARE